MRTSGMKRSGWSRWSLGAAVIVGIALVGLVAPTPVAAQTVNLFTGTADYSIPIVVPPDTNGVGPSLALVYSSHGGSDWIGSEWSLAGLGYVERLGPDYRPTPTYSIGSDTFRLVLGGAEHKLVYNSATGYYHTQIESFLQIQYVPTSPTYWIVTDKGGTKFYFGQTAASQQNNPGDTTKVFRWRLDKVLDPHGTYWTVSYDKDTTNGDMYPQQIVYTQGAGLACTPSNLSTCRTVDFLSEARTDVQTSYLTGAKIVSDRRLQAVEVRLGGQLVRKYTLGYTMSSATARSLRSVSQLTSLTETGADGTTALPPLTFTYNVDSNASQLSLGPTAMINDPAEALFENCAYPVDINGDGLTDVLVGWGAGNYYAYPNLGYYAPTGGYTFDWLVISNPPTPFPSLCSTRSEYRREHRVNPFSLFLHMIGWLAGAIGGGPPGVAAAEIAFDMLKLGVSSTQKYEVLVRVHDTTVVDLDGDGLPDIVHAPAVSQWYWWKNLGNGQFADRADVMEPPPVKLDDVAVRLVDVDSDGLLA